MLEKIALKHVGPAPEMSAEFAPRLNLITGDNGLGKTFLLDIAWWALTRTWARNLVIPRRASSPGSSSGSKSGPKTGSVSGSASKAGSPSIYYRCGTKSRDTIEHTSKFDRQMETWSLRRGRPAMPGMVIYAQVGGGFSVWDPARNYWKSKGDEDRPQAYLFSQQEVWDGLPDNLSEGLIRDWASWQREAGDAFDQLTRVLRQLSPSENEVLTPGPLTRISLKDTRDHPTLRMLYGQDVALVHASAGMRRVVALAYLLVWTWQEHLKACDLQEIDPAKEIIFLVDEIEAHLHPQWQRCIVPALIEVMEALTGTQDVPVQLIAATHSPLVLASAEPLFDEERDRVFNIELAEDGAQIEEWPWSKQGDVIGWLASGVFGMQQARSRDAERAIEAAEAFMRGDSDALPDDLQTKEAIHQELRRVLAGQDPFWPRWIVETREDRS